MPRKTTYANVLCGRREWTSNGNAFHTNVVPGLARSAFAKKTLSISGKGSFEISDPYLKVQYHTHTSKLKIRADGSKNFLHAGKNLPYIS